MGADLKATKHFVTLEVKNDSAAEVMFYLEPWGTCCEMPPGATFELVARGYEDDRLLLEHSSDRITLWAEEVKSARYGNRELPL